MLVIKLKQLMAEKCLTNGGKITYSDISEETGIGISSLSRIANTHKINSEHIEKLCKYFDCTPNDLMALLPDPPSASSDSK